MAWKHTADRPCVLQASHPVYRKKHYTVNIQSTRPTEHFCDCEYRCPTAQKNWEMGNGQVKQNYFSGRDCQLPDLRPGSDTKLFMSQTQYIELSTWKVLVSESIRNTCFNLERLGTVSYNEYSINASPDPKFKTKTYSIFNLMCSCTLLRELTKLMILSGTPYDPTTFLLLPFSLSSKRFRLEETHKKCLF